MGLSVMCLFHKREALSSTLSNHIKKKNLDTAVHVCNPRAGEAETRGSLGLDEFVSLRLS